MNLEIGATEYAIYDPTDTRAPVLTGQIIDRGLHDELNLAQNAIHHAPNREIKKSIGAELRTIWNADNIDRTNENLKRLVESYGESAPKLAAWLETNVPEGLTVFELPA